MLSHRRAGRNIATRAPAAGRYVDAVRDPDAGHAPTLFLIVGLPGAGKTVRARALAAEHGALLMTPDAWMIALFGQSQPDGKREVVEGRLIGLAIEALCLRLSVVLDFGLWTRDERSALRWMAASVGDAVRSSTRAGSTGRRAAGRPCVRASRPRRARSRRRTRRRRTRLCPTRTSSGPRWCARPRRRSGTPAGAGRWPRAQGSRTRRSPGRLG
jgi:hypothetical protein